MLWITTLAELVIATILPQANISQSPHSSTGKPLNRLVGPSGVEPLSRPFNNNPAVSADTNDHVRPSERSTGSPI